VGLYGRDFGYLQPKHGVARNLSAGGHFIRVAGLNETADCVLAGEGDFLRAPEIGVIRQGKYRTVKSFDLGYGEEVQGQSEASSA